MSKDMENLTEAQRICGSSVADGVVDMLNVTDLEIARACLDRELSNMNRVTMLKVIKRRIKQLEKPWNSWANRPSRRNQ